jgi:hypothetical protein
MSEIIAAADQVAATTLLHDAEAALGTPSASGSGSFGPFGASYLVSVSFSGGTVNLNPPNIIELANCNLHYSVSLSFSLDLNSFLPHFCLPQVCVFGICTPKICINWPTITVPFSFGDNVSFTADFTLDAHLSGSNWLIDVVIVGVPLLQFGPATAGILAALGAALSLALLGIPFIGPFLAAAVALTVAAVGVAGLTGFLGIIITPFVSGLRFNIYKQPQVFPVLPGAGPIDPEVDIKITALGATVQATDKNELVIAGDITT